MDTEAYFKAKVALSQFLEEHPNLREKQEMIEESLRKAGKGTENRLAVIRSLMMASLMELNEALKKISAVSGRTR